MKTVLLPVKDFQNAKQRLAPAVAAAVRADLARAMLADVLNSISKARTPQRVVVFTASEKVIQMTRPFGFEVVLETSVDGHSAAVNHMVEELSPTARGFYRSRGTSLISFPRKLISPLILLPS